MFIFVNTYVYLFALINNSTLQKEQLKEIIKSLNLSWHSLKCILHSYTLKKMKFLKIKKQWKCYKYKWNEIKFSWWCLDLHINLNQYVISSVFLIKNWSEWVKLKWNINQLYKVCL